MYAFPRTQPELRASLVKRARCYFPDEADQDLLIIRTISAVCDDPQLIDIGCVQTALYKVMHQLAQVKMPQCEPSSERDFASA